MTPQIPHAPVPTSQDPERRTAFNWYLTVCFVVVGAGLVYLFLERDALGAFGIIMLGLFFGFWGAFGPRIRDWVRTRLRKGDAEMEASAGVNDPDVAETAEADVMKRGSSDGASEPPPGQETRR